MKDDFKEPVFPESEQAAAPETEETAGASAEQQPSDDAETTPVRSDWIPKLQLQKIFPVTRAIVSAVHKTLAAVWALMPVKLTVTLLLITCIAAGLLGYVSSLTAGPIAAHTQQALDDALREVMPDVNSYEPSAAQPDGLVTAMYLAKKDGALAGYCIAAQPVGYGGVIQLMVGIDPLGEVTAVKVMKMSETPSLGARAAESGWLAQFVGKRLGVHLGGDDEDIHAISGATITSQAVTDGVAAALAFLAAQT